jgi:hypothetical protein
VALGWPLWAAGLLSFGLGLARLVRPKAVDGEAERARLGDLLATVWVLTLAVMISSSRNLFLRYLLPLCPFLCIAAARLLASWRERATGRAASRVALLAVLAVVLPTAAYTAAHVHVFALEDPRDSARAWFLAHVPEGASVGFPVRLDHRTPPVAGWGRGPGGEPVDTPGYRWVELRGDPARLDSERPDFIVLNPQVLADGARAGDARAAQLARRLEEEYEIVGGAWSHHPTLFGLSFEWREPPRGWNAAGMEVMVLRRR